ncbi:unnamed protein product [Paramecium pentaurelia]|uniref:Uncharacterized protein n=1 Tax=Paramecium pentaurelia TaxID=43138 RepID=A0A8S1SHY1_9CILI|nr:unnamed protein product [Paramecium pentaurelia]
MFIVFAAAFQLSTRITQDFKMPILNSDQINPWFLDGQNHNEAFVDWEGNRVRQFHTFNDNPFPINITLRISTQSEFYPFIQESLQQRFPEVDEITYTLLPKQSYQLAIEYNCSQHNEGIQQIDLIFMEQTFKNNPQNLDELNQISIRYYKFCQNPHTAIIDLKNLMALVLIYITTTCSSLFCIRRVFIQFEFTPTKQLITLILAPAIGSFLFYPETTSFILALIVLYDFIYYASKSQTVSIIVSFIIFYVQYYIFKSAQTESVNLHPLFNQILPYILTIILLIQVNRRIIIANKFQLFLFFCIIWLTEIYSLVHRTQVDKHLLIQHPQEMPTYIKTKFSFLIVNNDSVWQQKNIDIHLYQLIGLSLIQSFIFRHGLFNKEHIINIVVVGITQFTGLIIFDLLYRYKHNPPFLTLITGFILLGMVLNYLRTGSGLRNPYLEFESIEEKIKI